MKNSQKGIISTLSLIIIIVIVILGGVIYFINKGNSPSVTSNSTNPVSQNIINNKQNSDIVSLPSVLDPCKIISVSEVSKIAPGVDTATNIGKNCTFSIGKPVYRKTMILDFSISVEDPINYPQSFSEYIKIVCTSDKSCVDVSQSSHQAFWIGSSLQASYKGYRIVSPKHGLNTNDQVEQLIKLVVSKL